MSNWATIAWPVPRATNNFLASLPHSHPPDHILDDLKLSGKKAFFKNQRGYFTNYVSGVRGPAEDSGVGSFPFSDKKGACSPWAEKKLCIGYCV